MKHVVLLKSGAKHQGGLEKAASRIAKAFADRGARVSILTTGASKPAHLEPAISVFSTLLSSWPPFLRIEQFDRFARRWLTRNPADLIFGMDRNRFQTHIRAGNGVHAAFLESRIRTEGRWKYLSCLLNPMHRKILEFEKTAFEHPGLRKLFTNSYMVKAQILDRFSVEESKIQVIHNGVEWEEMGADFAVWEQKKAELCRTLQLDPNVFQLLFIGNGFRRKGLPQLLEGLARLKSYPFQLSVLGKDSRSEDFQALAAHLGLEKKVRFFGPRADIRAFYQIADALAIPSFYDPFANVTVEALAMGLYVVSSQSNGGHEILTPKTGWIIQDLNAPDAVVEGLAEAFRHPKNAASAFEIRQSVRYLDYAHQMQILIEACDG